jgi:hypothetical protein
VHGMEYCVGLNKAINHWRKLASPRFEPGSPKWHTGALSTTPRAHALEWQSLRIVFSALCQSSLPSLFSPLWFSFWQSMKLRSVSSPFVFFSAKVLASNEGVRDRQQITGQSTPERRRNNFFNNFFWRGCPGWGANPGPLDFIYFLIFTTFNHSGSAPYDAITNFYGKITFQGACNYHILWRGKLLLLKM